MAQPQATPRTPIRSGVLDRSRPRLRPRPDFPETRAASICWRAGSWIQYTARPFGVRRHRRRFGFLRRTAVTPPSQSGVKAAALHIGLVVPSRGRLHNVADATVNAEAKNCEFQVRFFPTDGCANR